jgi:hypothetical protein
MTTPLVRIFIIATSAVYVGSGRVSASTTFIVTVATRASRSTLQSPTPVWSAASNAIVLSAQSTWPRPASRWCLCAAVMLCTRLASHVTLQLDTLARYVRRASQTWNLGTAPLTTASHRSPFRWGFAQSALAYIATTATSARPQNITLCSTAATLAQGTTHESSPTLIVKVTLPQAMS